MNFSQNSEYFNYMNVCNANIITWRIGHREKKKKELPSWNSSPGHWYSIPMFFELNQMDDIQYDTLHSYMFAILHLQHKLEHFHATQPCGKHAIKIIPQDR